MATGIGLHDIPGEHHAFAYVPSHAAATATENVVVFKAPFSCKLHAVYLTPAANVTGQATNYTNVNLINRGTDGDGTTELSSIDFNAASATMTAYVPKALYSSSDGVSLDEGTVLTIELEKVASGLLLPAMLVDIVYRGD